MMLVCNQCGALREDWQYPEDNRCPNNAMPEPYSSCDGTLIYKESDVRPLWYDVDMVDDPPN